MDAKTIAREMVEGSAVLLKNTDGLLPLARGKRVAFLGRAQREMVLSGNGSGATWGEAAPLLDCCEEAGLQPIESLVDFYRALSPEKQTEDLNWSDLQEMARLVHSGAIYEYFGRYRPTSTEPVPPQALIRQAANETDTAILILSRSAGGEECDRRLENDYYLSEQERLLIDEACASFPNVALVLNINGLIDMNWLERYSAIKSVLFIGVTGEAGAQALARILTGAVNPSGRLAVTIPKRYEDIPCANDFSCDKENNVRTYADYGLDARLNGSRGFAISPVTVYREGLYVGYRYYNSFHVEPIFPFGFGLSYTRFEWEQAITQKVTGGMLLQLRVTNTGLQAGREVVQLYVSSPCDDCPAHTLQGFAKTSLLMPNASGLVTIQIPWRAFARYDEQAAAWVIEQGVHRVMLGRDSQRVELAAVVTVAERLTLEQCQNRLGVKPVNRDRLDFLRCEKGIKTEMPSQTPTEHRFTLKAEDISAGRYPMSCLRSETPTPDLSDFSIEELAALCVGYGSGVPFSAFQGNEAPNTIIDEGGNPLTVNDHPTGLLGYVSPAIPKRGIHSLSYRDGPAGIGLTAYPSQMLLACSFDRELCRRFGDAVGGECEAQKVDVWLAPAVNLHRHPLCGRSFEYFSEDPFLSGVLAVAITQGVQQNHPVLVCPKHLAANEQETFRRGSARQNADAVDSIVTERALRELYLLPFEMLVREAGVRCIMTSFNKINGVLAGGNRELCTDIQRDEWGFDGAVVTDWGDMDTVVDGADAVAAGNDIIMPGGPPVIAEILKGFTEGRVNRNQLEAAVSHLLIVANVLR